MFKDPEGPSHEEVAEAANRLQDAAFKRGGRVRVEREMTPDGEREWDLMNRAADWLESQGLGRVEEGRHTQAFEFVSTLGG